MRVLITGVTGFIGSRLAAVLTENGHAVTGLSRNPDKARERVPSLVDAHAWDPVVEPPPAGALDGIDAVVHLAGELVAGRWTAEKKRRIEESRVIGTRNLVAGFAAPGAPDTLVNASAIGYYGDRGDEVLTEGKPPGDDFLADVCQGWEREAQRAAEHGSRVVLLRIGIVLAPGGGALEAMLPPFKLGAGGPMGSGRQWWSWVHRDDLVGIIRFALENEAMSGVYNATAPAPMQQKAFAKVLGKVLRRPAFVPTPGFALRLLLGGFATELLSSKRVVPERLQEAGYDFEHPELEGALRQALGT